MDAKELIAALTEAGFVTKSEEPKVEYVTQEALTQVVTDMSDKLTQIMSEIPAMVLKAMPAREGQGTQNVIVVDTAPTLEDDPDAYLTAKANRIYSDANTTGEDFTPLEKRLLVHQFVRDCSDLGPVKLAATSAN